jgi:hypothetical protein
MFAPDLRLVEDANLPSATPIADAPAAQASRDSAQAETTPAALPTIVPLASQRSPEAPPLTRIALTAQVLIVDQRGQPRPNIRVQLVDVAGVVVRAANTDAAGQTTLRADLPGSAIAWVRIPAAAVVVPVDPGKPQLVFTLPNE